MRHSGDYFAVTIFTVFISFWCLMANAQDSTNKDDSLIVEAKNVDHRYIKTFSLVNDIRIFPGILAHGLKFQSKNENGIDYNIENYNNSNTIIGFGLTYKFIDFDLTFTLPTSRVNTNILSNLSQFKLLASYTSRKNSFRVYISESNGIISTNPSSNFESSPNINLIKLGGQVTHIFNSTYFSYRAANFQSEIQLKSAGSFLLRFEPFYRKIGLQTQGEALTPKTTNVKDVFEEQAGLYYLYAPGLVLMPGYSYTAVIKQGRYYVSPMILLGPGFAVNTYKSDEGNFRTLNWEGASLLSLNIGYNGSKVYSNLRLSSDLTYSNLNPSFFTTNEIKIYLTVGYRFKHLENKIPVSF